MFQQLLCPRVDNTGSQSLGVVLRAPKVLKFVQYRLDIRTDMTSDARPSQFRSQQGNRNLYSTVVRAIAPPIYRSSVKVDADHQPVTEL
jgi:hypothetical protein